MGRAPRGRLRTRLGGFRVRVALSAVATALLLLGVRGSHGTGLEARGAPPHLQIAVTYRTGASAVPATYAFPAGT